jgi:hypothetical protein
MDTLNKIKELTESLSYDTQKAIEKGNKSAATRARKTAQDIKNLLQELRKEVLEATKK